MSARISYKKQSLLGFMLLLVLISVVEVFANIWSLSAEKCTFEENEVFNKLDPELRKKICQDHFDTTLVDLYQPHQQSLTININSEGFRGPEFSVEKPLNTYRIFMVGASTTFGAGSTSDETSIPGYLQEIIDEQNFDYKIEVINAGVGGSQSLREGKLIREKLVNYDPDLILIYDGWSDLRQPFSPNYVGSNWRQTCEFGNTEGFDVIVTLQPIAGFGHKILTKQEFANVLLGRDFSNKPLDVTSYEAYSLELRQLNNVCTTTADLRGIFDGIQTPIYYDEGHVGDKGNKIAAENFFKLIKPLLIQNNLSSDDVKNQPPISSEIDNVKETNINLEYVSLWTTRAISYYKTPVMINEFWNGLTNQHTDFTIFQHQQELRSFDPFAGLSDTDVLRNKYLGQMELSNQNFDNSDLSGAFLSHSNLEFSTFRGSDLSNTQLESSNLINANLFGANLTNANLFGANLMNANLDEAILTGTYLEHVDLSKFDMSGKVLSGLNLSGIDFTGYDNAIHLTTGFDLSNKDLTDTNLSNSNLSGQNLKNTVLIRTILSNAILQDVNLSGKDLSGAAGKDLSGADLSGADLSGADLSGADLSGADLSGADLTQTNLDNAIIKDTNLENSVLKCINHPICD